jgi:hypothetical protein
MVNDLAVAMEVEPTIESEIREKQLKDPKLMEIRQLIRENKTSDFSKDSQVTLWLGKWVCVPDQKNIKELILREAHDSTYSIHPGSTKMYKDLKTQYWWYGMKRDITEYISFCDTCQRVKAEHQRPTWLLQPLKIPEWRWEKIGMDFIVGLPRTQASYDLIWVIVDRLTKVAHFVPIKMIYSGAKLAELYMSWIVCLHGVPKMIVSDRASQFTSKFWEKPHESMDTKLNFSSAYHPLTDGQMERTNQILEVMLRACALKYGESSDKSLPYTEFSYYNSNQTSIEMAPYEALYGWQCRTPLFSSQTRESQVFGPEVLRDIEKKVQMVHESLKVAQTWQKSYADKQKRDLSFEISDFIYLKVSSLRGTQRFKVEGKLAPRYVGPFKVIDHKGEVAYQLELPPQLSDVHDVFHVSQLMKCLRVLEEQLPMEELDLGGDLTYSERPVKVLDTVETVTRSRVIKMCNVHWSHHTEHEAT